MSINKNVSTIHAAFDGATCASKFNNGINFENYNIGFDSYEDIANLKRIGYDFDAYNFGMDAIQSLTTTASVGTPIQFLQGWLPGFVRRTTASRKIDDILGMTVIGDFSDAQIVQSSIENTGFASIYSDKSDVPLTGYNTNFIFRDTVRFESGFEVTTLEAMQTSKMRVDAATEKRMAVTNYVLEIARNKVGFYGYNNGNNQIYGLLNDPNLPAYNTVATGPESNSKLWANKTPVEIISDITSAINGLRTQSKEIVDPQQAKMTLVLSTSVRDYLTKVNNFNLSASKFLKENYPNIRIISAPEFDGANGGANVFYLFPDKIDEGSSDGGQTFVQLVPTKFMVTGVMKILKGYKESFANCLAGVLCKRPYGVYRATGI